ncbi:unnamed protein product [Mytilus edulis]|uniref:Uncharacterized protein n=1 Tax=Mytilus edulis TaxID=6550 RepID=A0A8S3RMA6_MYTED|nr:unnamed protein product [Mytilus edulis]
MERMHGIEETMHDDEFVSFEIKCLEEKKNFKAQEIKTEEAISFIEENLGKSPIKKSSLKNIEEMKSCQIGNEMEMKPSSSPKRVTEQDALLLHHFGSVNRNFETDSDQSPLIDSEVSSELLKEAHLPGEELLYQVEELAEEDSKLIDTINASLVAKEVVINVESTSNAKVMKMTKEDILQRFDEGNSRKITGQVNPAKDVMIMNKHVVIQTDKKCTLSVKTDDQGNKSIITGASEPKNATQNEVEMAFKHLTSFKERDSLNDNENDPQDKDEKKLVKVHQIINVPKKLVPPYQAKINLPKPDEEVHNTVVYLPKNIKSVDMTVANMDNDDEDVYILFVM